MSTITPSVVRPTEPLVSTVLRWSAAVVLLLLFIPVVVIGVLLAPWGRIVRTPCATRGGQVFSLLSWRWHGKLGLWLNHSALASWPRAFQLFSGNLAWVGLYPHPVADAAPSVELTQLLRTIKPGVFSLWGLRHRTGRDYDDLWRTQLEYARSRSLRYDYNLFFDNIFAMALHPLPVRAHAPSVVIDTLRVDNLDMSAAVDRVLHQLNEPTEQLLHVAFVKVAGVNWARRNAKYRNAVNQADLCLPEGLSVRRAASWLGTPLAQRVDRAAFAQRLWPTLAERRHSVFLLGGEAGEALRMAQRLRHDYPGLEVLGTKDWVRDADPRETIDLINASGADVLFTGMPFPEQEPWIVAHRNVLKVKAVVGLASAFGALATGLRAADALQGWLGGHVSFSLAVVLQRWLGSVKPLREMPVVVRPGDVKAPGNAVVLVSGKIQDELLKPFDVVPALLPVGAPRALVRVMELLAEKGCRHVDIVTDVDALRLRECLGHGERWGLSIEFHLVEDDADLLQRCAQLPVLNEVEPEVSDPRDHLVWLVDAACWLPDGTLGDAVPEDEQVWTGGSVSQWAGWACLARPNLRDCFKGVRNWAELEAAVIALLQGKATRRAAADVADLRSLVGIMSMLRHPTMGILEPANWHRLEPSEYEGVQGEVWVSREALLEPGVQLTGPIYIGPGAHVASHAVLGPGVILGRNVRIGSDLSLSQAIVLDGVCLGGGLDIRESLVDARGIANHAWQVVVPAHALGSLLTGTL